MATVNKWDILDNIGWDPHPGQLEVAESPMRHRVVSAGRRFGKSDLGGHELIPEAFVAYTQQNELRERKMRREYWIVGPNYTDSEKEFRVLYNELKRLDVPFDKPGTYNDPLGGNMHISLWCGTFQVNAKSAQYPESLVGEGLFGAILAEAAKLKEKVWTRFIRPTLADYNGWSLHTSTPEGKNWFYDSWRRGQDPANVEWASWRMPSWINPYVYKTPTTSRDVTRLQEIMRGSLGIEAVSIEDIIQQGNLNVDPEIASLLADLTETSFNQEIAADFTEFVGRVFKEFDEETHVFDLHYQSDWDTVAAVDYGFTNPNVWLLLQIGPWGEVNILDEFYMSGLTAQEFSDEIVRNGLCPSSLRTFYPDPASPGDTRVLEGNLKVRATHGTGGELKYRLDAIRAALKRKPEYLPDDHPQKMPQLRIDRQCVETIREFNEYRYPEKRDQSSTKSQEQPMKKDDHTPEALGRFFKGHFGTPSEQIRGTRVRKARVRA